MKKIDSISFRIYGFLARKIGYKRTPQVIPILVIAKAIGCSYDQVRDRIELLKELGLLEKWTVKHPEQFKVTYFRLTFTDSVLETESGMKVNRPKRQNTEK